MRIITSTKGVVSPVEMMLDHGILLVVLNKFRDPLYSLTPHTVACLVHMFIHLHKKSQPSSHDNIIIMVAEMLMQYCIVHIKISVL